MPFYKSCNDKLGQELSIDNDAKLVSANVGETCGKSISECDFGRLF